MTVRIFRSLTPISKDGIHRLNAVAAIDYAIFALLLALIVLFPTQLQILKAVLLLMYISIRLGHLSSIGCLNFDRYNFTIPLFLALIGLAYCLYGLILDAPGALNMLTVHAVYPLVFGFLAGTTMQYEARGLVSLIGKLSAFGTLLIVLLFVWYVTGHDNIALFSDANADVNNDAGYTKLSFPLLALLNFSAPFLIAQYAILPSKERGVISLFVVVLVILAAIVTGRRATWLVLLFGLLFPVFFVKAKGRYLLRLVLITLVGGSLAFWSGGLEWEILWDRLLAGFEFSSMADAGSALARGIQFDALMRGFEDNVFFGHGLGATAANYGSIRSEEQPWAYELSYVYYLFALGLVGVFIYAVGILALVYALYRLARHPDFERFAFPLLAGMLGFLIANATNPYLAKFDYMFALFVPYAIVVAVTKNSCANKG